MHYKYMQFYLHCFLAGGGNYTQILHGKLFILYLLENVLLYLF